VQNAGRAALLLPLVLLGCSSLTLTKEDPPASGPDPAYNKMIAEHLQQTFKDINTYDSFEISEFRWMHTAKGWTWLTCIRFEDHGHNRAYALFLKDKEIIASRYAVATDGCATQTYSPFNLIAGQTSPANAGALAPLY
jgi:hypothetical protein